ncbi:hypothetical protein D3C76_1177640 [compost metagenome]
MVISAIGVKRFNGFGVWKVVPGLGTQTRCAPWVCQSQGDWLRVAAGALGLK